MSTAKSLGLVMAAASLVSCSQRCASIDDEISQGGITRIEVYNTDEQRTNVLPATPELLQQFSKTNRVPRSNRVRQYSPGYVVFQGTRTNFSMHYYGNRTFWKECTFEIKTTNEITACFK